MSKNIIQAIKDYSTPIIKPSDIQHLVQEIRNEKYVLLGESSHGTSEYYKMRTEITKRLIIEKGFTFIAVEGDWPACQQVNRYIKSYEHNFVNANDVLKKSFNRWPTWMWANEEMVDLIEWLKNFNQQQPRERKVGFYGIDIYSLWESIDEILQFLQKRNSPDLEVAKKVYSCFAPFQRQAEKYALSASFYSEGCHEEVSKLLTVLTLKKNQYKDSEESRLNLEVNAIITANAEDYYKTMITNDNESWNIRDRHMVEIIHRINSFYQNTSKGIIWEHNTHIGDARATDMANEGLVNVGQLMREQIGPENIYAVGFGTNRGTVIAANEWGLNFTRMIVPPATTGSWEDAMYKAGSHDKVLVFTNENKHYFKDVIGHRAIGVVYDPRYEHYGNYVPSIMADRYDAFVYIHSTNALSPLQVERVLI
ncbi:erythromycin esterase family protein [Fredinandcohnia humi]